jgi:Zn-dependent protease
MFGFINFGESPDTLARKILVLLPIFLISITLHEFAHAAVARALGDPTADQAGRVTLNPLAHLDLLGTLMILFGPIGWAKPVPIDPARLGRWGTLLTAAAGPAANLLIAIVAIFALKHLPAGIESAGAPAELMFPFIVAMSLNIGLAVFNLLPIPPLDGSQIVYSVLPPRLLPAYHRLLPYGVLILVAMIVLPAGGAALDGILDATRHALIALVP